MYDGQGRCSLDMIFPLPAAIQNPADFHGVSDYHIENGEITDLNPIVRMLALPGGMVRFKRFRTGESLQNRIFHIIDQPLSRCGIPQPIGDIVHNFTQIFFKERKDA